MYPGILIFTFKYFLLYVIFYSFFFASSVNVILEFCILGHLLLWVFVKMFSVSSWFTGCGVVLHPHFVSSVCSFMCSLLCYTVYLPVCLASLTSWICVNFYNLHSDLDLYQWLMLSL